ncbi:MAG: DUF4900 domain-containing protein [Candidatus Omnitrophota bacterium]
MQKRGIILVATALVLSVLLILTAVFFSSTVSEKRASDTSKYANQSLYLAEAGINHGLSELRKRINSDLNIQLNKVSRNNAFDEYLNNSLGFLADYAYEDGQPQFSIINNEAQVSLTAIGLGSDVRGTYSGTIFISPNGIPTKQGEVYNFPYKFRITGTGLINAVTPNITRQVSFLNGEFSVRVQRGNFARYALFTFHHMMENGTTVWFTDKTQFYGPVHTNERFSFAGNPSGRFDKLSDTGIEVSQKMKTTRYYNNGRSIFLDASSNPPRDVPQFGQGVNFLRDVPLINLESVVTSNDLRVQALGDMNEPGQDGIYVPNDGANVTGGVYIRGDADSLIMSVVGGNARYAITQGSTTKEIIVDYANNQTTVREGENSNTYQGIPDGVGDAGVIIYGKGNIRGVSGMVQNCSQVTISSERDIVINNHIRYEQYNAGPPVNATGYENLLGLLSWGGDVRIGADAPSNLDIHAVIMSVHGVFTVDNYDSRSPSGNVTLLGGAITDFYGAFGTFSGSDLRSGYGRKFIYDQRMLEGYAPPYFPTLSNYISTPTWPSALLTWKEGVLE